MIRAVKVLPPGHWTAQPADTVVLDFDDRHRRRMAMSGTRGLDFLLDLAEAVALRSGDGLLLEDGRLVEVVAAPEPLIEIRGHDPQHLVRIAWHLGNRHLPTQIVGRGLRIRKDHVIEEMVRGLGARTLDIEAPFDPEGGAYSGGHGEAEHGHDHGDHDHHHGHGDHAHDHHHGPHDHDHHGHDHHACGHHHDHDGHDHKHDHSHGHRHAHGHSD